MRSQVFEFQNLKPQQQCYAYTLKFKNAHVLSFKISNFNVNRVLHIRIQKLTCFEFQNFKFQCQSGHDMCMLLNSKIQNPKHTTSTGTCFEFQNFKFQCQSGPTHRNSKIHMFRISKFQISVSIGSYTSRFKHDNIDKDI